MRKYKKIALFLCVVIALVGSFETSSAGIFSKKKVIAKVETPKKETPYDKLFKNKKIQTSKGFINIHNIEGKVYFELPVALLGEELLLSSNIERVSNPDLAYVGQKASNYSRIIFSRTDSLALISLVGRGNLSVADESEDGINQALKSSNRAPIILATPVVAMSPDSSAIVFDASSLFLDGNKNIVNVNNSSGTMTFLGTYKKPNSLLREVAAFDDNIAIVTDLSFGMRILMMGMSSVDEIPLTVTVHTTISALPETGMKPRAADMRIGTNLTLQTKYSSDAQGTQTKYLANHWRIEPSDSEAYSSGVAVDPAKPIIFYIDTLFTPSCTQAIKKGVESWNKAFEEVGFKNVIQAMPYPRDDSTFNASNTIKFNCIKNVMNESRGVSKNILIDPRTGEILSASMSFGKELESFLLRERILRTAAADSRVRSNRLPDDLMCEAITALMIRETGYCLGLSYNLGGSSSYPVDSLRSATFTATNGLSASAMDILLFNALAQAGDAEKGVKLVTTDIGVYDRYAIKWLYSPIPQAITPEQERAQLNKWIEEKAGDTRFRYGVLQNSYMLTFDPRSLSNDIGDDIVKSTKIQLENLKYVANHCAEWIDRDNTDETNRDLFPDFVLLQAMYNIVNLSYSLGGIYIDEKYSGNSGAKYTSLPRKRQQEVFRTVMDILSDMSWIDNKELRLMSSPNANLSEMIIYNCFSLIFKRFTALSVSSYYSKDPYTIEDILDDMTSIVLKKVRTGDELSISNRIMLDMMITNVSSFTKASMASSKKSSVNGFALTDEQTVKLSAAEIFATQYTDNENARRAKLIGDRTWEMGELASTAGYLPIEGVNYYTQKDLGATYYSTMRKIQSAMNEGATKTRNEELRNYYKYNSLHIEKTLNAK